MMEAVRPHAKGLVELAAPGVDVRRFTPSPDGWQHNGYLLCVCRLAEPRKGLRRLIKAYAHMVDVDPSVPDLVLAGRGQLSTSDSSLIVQLGLSHRVRIQSDVPPERLPALYRGASVFVQASHEEGFGMSALEAMSCGVPVVATDTDGTRMSIRSGETGWLVAQGPDEDGVVQALATRTLQTLSADGAAMSERARRHVLDYFSSERSISTFIAVYGHITSDAWLGTDVKT
ncbi:glycosyltransferase family 4 protein [Blastococcus sp. BMG 814]|uniref:Glycosyltransferase family 4 protein n=1 Tax=Blastococcus carthaginiensis TaxID=3050034 RepID=A0ABT9IF56_9ACTN|nr:glycosyltransferase family 4 protein [Blastococcus carthaginiensis]MDP5183837.1 glycosyltransferase family 4 protein [Blastococcus carthaginiensis]